MTDLAMVTWHANCPPELSLVLTSPAQHQHCNLPAANRLSSQEVLTAHNCMYVLPSYLLPQFLNDGLTFAGALLLNLLVKHLEHAAAAPKPNSSSSADAVFPSWFPCPGEPSWGFVLAVLLGLSALAKAVIGSHYNYRLSVITVR